MIIKKELSIRKLFFYEIRCEYTQVRFARHVEPPVDDNRSLAPRRTDVVALPQWLAVARIERHGGGVGHEDDAVGDDG